MILVVVRLEASVCIRGDAQLSLKDVSHSKDSRTFE